MRIGLAVLLAALMTASCGGASTVAPGDANPESSGKAAASTVVALAVEGKLKGDFLVLNGTASVPDGAHVGYEVDDANIATDPGSGHFQIGDVAVTGGTFGAEVPVGDFVAGPMEVRVWFTLDDQPPEMIDALTALYGANGEKITGAQAYNDEATGGGHGAELVTSIEK